MQECRTFALVVSLSAAIVLGAARNGAPAPQRRHRAAADDRVITTILDYLALASRILIPPG